LHTYGHGGGRTPPPAPPHEKLAAVRLCRIRTTAPNRRNPTNGGAGGVAARELLQMLLTRLQNIC